ARGAYGCLHAAPPRRAGLGPRARPPFEAPPRFWPPRLSPLWVRLLRGRRLRALRRGQRIRSVRVQGAELVRQLLDEGAGVLLAPNHSFHFDSHVLMEAAEQLGRPLHFLTAWQVFAASGPWQRWLLQKHGCFSIDRESTDLTAVRTAIDILTASPHPLVIFPEGDVYHTNDR